jgi:hypothetical protein
VCLSTRGVGFESAWKTKGTCFRQSANVSDEFSQGCTCSKRLAPPLCLPSREPRAAHWVLGTSAPQPVLEGRSSESIQHDERIARWEGLDGLHRGCELQVERLGLGMVPY